MTRILFTALLGLILVGGARSGEKVFSGPQPGEKLSAFKVLSVAGPAAGKEVELIGHIKGGPTLLVFVHEVTRPAMQLFRPIDLYGSKLAQDGLATHFVWLTPDKAKTEQFLSNAKKSLSLKSPISISLDGQEGPGNYGLNRKVAVTILVAKDNKVVANFAIIQPNETDAPKVVEAIAKLMGKKNVPTLDELSKELGGPKKRPDPKGKSLELQKLMRRMIQMTNDEATVKQVADEMVKWAGSDAKKQTELRDYCRMVVRLGYGTEAAQRMLKKLAGD